MSMPKRVTRSKLNGMSEIDKNVVTSPSALPVFKGLFITNVKELKFSIPLAWNNLSNPGVDRNTRRHL